MPSVAKQCEIQPFPSWPPPLKEAPLIEISNATVWRGSTRVFHQFSLRIGQHERVAIIGPNGAGKTTLLKLISRELYPVAADDCRVSILGRERWNVWDLRKHIGLVSQDLQSGFMPNATVLETVVSGFFSSIGVHYQLQKDIRPGHIEKASTVLAMLGLEALRDREFKTLSTGQQRRCLLGRALVHDPDTLIFDEPTSGLDMSASFGYLRLIRELANKGRSLVLVTHHLNEIQPEINRVILWKEGKIVADGLKNTVLTSRLISDVYDTRIRIVQEDGYFLAYPGDRE